MLKGFKDFIMKGNVLDLAVAVIIGAAFTTVVNFLLVAAAVYFAIVLPMNKMIERRNRRLGITPEQSADPQVMLLTEIRDALTSQPPNGTAQSQEGPKH